MADRNVDIVTCSQVLHHFADGEAACLLREVHRVAPSLVVVADLRRSWVAVGQVPVVRDRIGFRVTAVWTPTTGLPATEIAT